MTHRTPLITAIFLLLALPLGYVGCYLALVSPFQGVGGSRFFVYPVAARDPVAHRRLHTLFRPLEWIDRHVRPQWWLPPEP